MSHHKINTKAAKKLIEQRAYFKWLAAGKPSGDGKQFWYEAERELTRAEVLLEEVIELDVELK